MRTKTLSVVAWPKSSPSNAYTGSLSAALAEHADVEVTDLGMGLGMLLQALTRRFDILHIHWLERAFWAPNRPRLLRQVVQILIVSALLKLRGAKIVWTAHDPTPHESGFNRSLFTGWTSRLWRLYRSVIAPRIDGIILLSASHLSAIKQTVPSVADLPLTVISHPHYLGQYPDTVSRSAARARLRLGDSSCAFGFVGGLRSYKNPDGLIQAFSGVKKDAVLLVAGAAEDLDYERRIFLLASKDTRVLLNLGFVAAHDLQLWLRALDLVVLPYREATNSGSAYLALSFDVPVLVPDLPVFRELEQSVGSGWIRRYQGSLSADILDDAASWVRTEARSKSPDLTQLSWESTAHQYRSFYDRVIEGA